MSQFIKLNDNNFRNITVRLNPERDYTSGSSGAGVTGSIFLFPYTSSVEYVQVFNGEASGYPGGGFWGTSSILYKQMRGLYRLAAYRAANPEPLWGDSIHNIKSNYSNDSGQSYFESKTNPEFFITRKTPLINAENNNVLSKDDIYVWVQSGNNKDMVRYWQIETGDDYETKNGNIKVDETQFKGGKWFEKITAKDKNTDGLAPRDDGEYKSEGLVSFGIPFSQEFHKINSSDTQKDIGIVNNIKNVLMPYYKVECPTMDYSYSNYHCLNFFSSSAVSDNAAIIYKSPQIGKNHGAIGKDEIDFSLSSSFTIESWIKPTGPQNHAGTILHYSGNYSLSLITASSDSYEYGDNRFKLMLQLSSSANISPHLTSVDISDNTNLVFTSSHSLRKNYWHHIAVRWDKDKNIVGNTSRGDFIIDGSVDSNFYISSSILSHQKMYWAAGDGEEAALKSFRHRQVASSIKDKMDPMQLVVGNFYSADAIFDSGFGNFFNTAVSYDEGLSSLAGETEGSSYGDPSTIDFGNPLNAEIHEVRIWKQWKSLDEINAASSTGLSTGIVTNASASGLKFYLPLLFTEQVSVQDQYKYSPKKGQEDVKNQDDESYLSRSLEIHPYPFNVPLAMGTNGYEMNIQNFLRDYARRQNSTNTSGMPRLYNLTGSLSVDSVAKAILSYDANKLLESPQMIRRNLTILPCDNGRFVPNFELCSILSQSKSVEYPYGKKFRSSYGKNYPIGTYANINPSLPTYDYSSINLDGICNIDDQVKLSINVISSSNGKVVCTPRFPTADYFYIKTHPANIQSIHYYIPTMLQSSASNNVCYFDIPSLFYGREIKHGSFYIKDSNITGSDSQFSITLKDDGRGNLYRADAKTEHALWNSVGNMFYSEGLAFVKSPHLYNFGKDKFEIGFSGTLEKHVQTLEFEVPAIFANSSSNVGYKGFVSDSPNKYADNTLISNINIYDKDFNVISRASLVQSFAKEKDKDRIFIRLNLDY